MNRVHCDYEECKANIATTPNDQNGAPVGWAIIIWTAQGKPIPSSNSRMMKAYAKAISTIAPDDARGAFKELGEAASDDMKPTLAVFKAYICPDCIQTKLPISGFNIIGQVHDLMGGVL